MDVVPVKFRRAAAGTAEAISSVKLGAHEGQDPGCVVLDLTELFPDVLTSITRSWALELAGAAAATDALLVTIGTAQAEALFDALGRALDVATNTTSAEGR